MDVLEQSLYISIQRMIVKTLGSECEYITSSTINIDEEDEKNKRPNKAGLFYVYIAIGVILW